MVVPKLKLSPVTFLRPDLSRKENVMIAFLRDIGREIQNAKILEPI